MMRLGLIFKSQLSIIKKINQTKIKTGESNMSRFFNITCNGNYLGYCKASEHGAADWVSESRYPEDGNWLEVADGFLYQTTFGTLLKFTLQEDTIMGKLYQFKPRMVQEYQNESEGVKQIRRNMEAWRRKQAKVNAERQGNNNRADANGGTRH
jgi:hypothetical protein